ncbi:unnamed protein product [Peniophora sp. CBMAI 1063]|nr:unnamed protein product [Peniophora sp. CBMAI 1063]
MRAGDLDDRLPRAETYKGSTSLGRGLQSRFILFSASTTQASSSSHLPLILIHNMMFKLSAAFLAVATLFVTVNALADNPVDACNGSNHYGVGHSCAFKTSDGSTSQGTCQTDASGDLVCIPN